MQPFTWPKLQVKPSDFGDLYELAKELLGWEIPPVLETGIGFLLLIAIAIGIIVVIVAGCAKIIELCSEKIFPVFQSINKESLIQARQQFAAFVLQEIDTLNRRENWSDQQFSELEAEVEAERIRSKFLSFFPPDPLYASARSVTRLGSRKTD